MSSGVPGSVRSVAASRLAASVLLLAGGLSACAHAPPLPHPARATQDFGDANLPRLPLFYPQLHRPSDPGVMPPRAVHSPAAQYTAAAMKANVEGKIVMQAVVLADGQIGDIRMTYSLHEELDEAALRAAREWRFEPGAFLGEPVPVVVSIEMTFSLRK